MTTKAKKPKSMKLRYAEDESGWALDLGDGRAEIANLPLTDLNSGDVVRLGPPTSCQCCPTIADVVERKWPKKTWIKYPEPHKENYKKICVALREERGWPTEGMVGGYACVAHPKGEKIKKILADAGVEVETEDGDLRPVTK